MLKKIVEDKVEEILINQEFYNKCILIKKLWVQLPSVMNGSAQVFVQERDISHQHLSLHKIHSTHMQKILSSRVKVLGFMLS